MALCVAVFLSVRAKRKDEPDEGLLGVMLHVCFPCGKVCTVPDAPFT